MTEKEEELGNPFRRATAELEKLRESAAIPDSAPNAESASTLVTESPSTDGTDRTDGTDGDTTEQEVENLQKQRRRKHSRLRSLVEWVAVLLIAFIVAVVIRTYAFQVFSVPSTSMVPSLLVGDRILVDKLFFNYHSLKRGDIVVFARPPADTMCGPNETDLVKRVIGLPGQTVSESSSGQVEINGKVITEPYLPANDLLGPKPIVTTKVPPNQFFMLGDNRSISCDSRFWGTISGSSIVGKVVAVIWRNNHPFLHLF